MRLTPLFLGIISELALYGLAGLVLVTAWFIVVERHGPFQRDNCQRIILHFSDANALSVGSPINFMGTPIGHVVKLRPHGHQVEVKIKTYPDSIPIPKNARFTIEFNSLAGAKSVEILPPEKGPLPLGYMRQGLYVIRQPIRLKDVVKTQMTLAEALKSSSANFMQTLGKLEEPAVMIDMMHGLDTNMRGMHSTLTYIQEVLLVGSQSIEESRKALSGNLGRAQKALRLAEQNTEPAKSLVPINETLRYIHHGAEDWRLFISEPSSRLLLQPKSARERVQSANSSLETFQTHLETTVPNVLQTWATFNQGLGNLTGALQWGANWMQRKEAARAAKTKGK